MVDAAIRSKEAVRCRTHSGPSSLLATKLADRAQQQRQRPVANVRGDIIYAEGGGLVHIIWTHDEEEWEVRGWWEGEENGEVDCAEEIDKFSATCPFAMCECVCIWRYLIFSQDYSEIIILRTKGDSICIKARRVP